MEGHKAQTKDALISVQFAVDILTDCTVNEGKEIFYPQTAPPSLSEVLTQISTCFPRISHCSFPPEHSSTQFA